MLGAGDRSWGILAGREDLVIDPVAAGIEGGWSDAHDGLIATVQGCKKAPLDADDGQGELGIATEKLPQLKAGCRQCGLVGPMANFQQAREVNDPGCIGVGQTNAVGKLKTTHAENLRGPLPGTGFGLEKIDELPGRTTGAAIVPGRPLPGTKRQLAGVEGESRPRG